MHNVGAALAVTLVSALQVAGCTSSKSITSLPTDKTLSSLTVDERRQYCEDRFHYMSSRVSKDDRKKIDCAAAAGTVGSTGGSTSDKSRTACKDVYQTCMGVPAAEPQSSCDDFPKSAADCAATVGDADACAETQADALEKLAGDADGTCKSLSTSRKARLLTSQVPESACAKVDRMCPKLFDEPALDRGSP